MIIKKSTLEDINEIMSMFDFSRRLMRESGNHVQWTNGYPSKELILQSIEKGNNFLILENDEKVAAFDFIIGEDPTYHKIENGNWLNNDIYGVIHRLATTGKVKGVAKFCFEWCFSQHPNIRLDTHQSNIAMQRVLSKLGYTECGIIYVSDGTPRIAFQKSK